MKRNITCFLLLSALVCSGFNSAAADDIKNPKTTLSLNPMGFLFFGPSLNLGLALNPKTVINANLRRNSWGLLARKIRESDPTLYSFTGMGYGMGLTHFVSNIQEGLYYGAIVSLDIQNTKAYKDQPYETREQTKTYGVLVNLGKRFNLGSKCFVNAGALLGAGLVKYHWEYIDPTFGITDPEPRKGSSIIPIGSLELAFGMFLR